MLLPLERDKGRVEVPGEETLTNRDSGSFPSQIEAKNKNVIAEIMFIFAVFFIYPRQNELKSRKTTMKWLVVKVHSFLLENNVFPPQAGYCYFSAEYSHEHP